MQQTGFLKEDGHRANLPRHAHDLSAQLGFTASTGMLLPVYYDFLNAGDSDYFSGSLMARAQPLVTQSMIDVEFYLDWFFVPMTMLINTWQNIRWQTRDWISNAWADTSRTFFQGQLPVYNIDEFNGCMHGTPVPTWQPNSWLRYNPYYYDCEGKAKFRLLNHLGFNPYIVFADSTENPGYDAQNLPLRENPNVFPQFALAYQAIFMNYFRIDDRDDFNVGSYNCDTYYTKSQVAPLHPNTFYNTNEQVDPFILRYRPFHDDYFRGVQASPMTSQVNLLGGFTADGPQTTPAFVLSRLNNYLAKGDSQNYIYPSNSFAVGISNAAQGNYSEGVGDLGSDFTTIEPRLGVNSSSVGTGLQLHNNNLTTANIRQMFAVEKLMRITGKAAKNYDAQMLAHFGVKIPHDVKHDLTHVGCDKAFMHIGQVVSTSDTFTGTSGSALGSLSGQGFVLVKGKKKKFTAPVDGIIMCLMSAVPRKHYYGGFDKQNSVTSRLDYFIPEFDRLGKQPMYAYECDYNAIGQATRVGWQWRYNQWKRKYNRLTEAFRQPRNNTSVNQYMPWVNGSKPMVVTGVAPYPDWEDLGDNEFYCTPHELDNCMVVPYVSTWNAAYNTTPWLMFSTDPFICEFSANVKKVSVMSPTGEPSLD